MKHIGTYLTDLVVIEGDRSNGAIHSVPPTNMVLVPTEEPYRSETIVELRIIYQRRLEKQFGRMTIPPRYANLSPFDLTKEELVGKIKAIQAAATWSLKKSSKPGLLIFGKPGVGKSALGWWAVPLRGWGLWQTWPGLYKAIQHGYKLGDARERLETAKSAPILFLDDLGDPDRVWYDDEGNIRSRMASDDQRDILFEIINHRCQRWAPIFITSNLTGAELLAQFGDRLVSRFLELCEFVEMGGIDLRRARS